MTIIFIKAGVALARLSPLFYHIPIEFRLIMQMLPCVNSPTEYDITSHTQKFAELGP